MDALIFELISTAYGTVTYKVKDFVGEKGTLFFHGKACDYSLGKDFTYRVPSDLKALALIFCTKGFRLDLSKDAETVFEGLNLRYDAAKRTLTVREGSTGYASGVMIMTHYNYPRIYYDLLLNWGDIPA